MNPNYGLYKGSTQMQKLYHGADKIYHVYKGEDLVWRDRAYDKDEVVFEQATGGDYTLNLLDDGVYRISCVGAGGTAVATPVYDDRGYLATGGSGSAIVGDVTLSAGTYTIHVGLNTGSDRDSSISGVVTAYGGGNASARLNAGAGGAIPTQTIAFSNITLNSAGNNGRSGTGGKGSSIPPIRIQRTASVYDGTITGYGAGGGGQASEYWQSCFVEAPIAGFIKIEYLHDSE